MTSVGTHSWSWVLEAPQPTLSTEGLQMIPQRKLWISLVSSFASYALADTYLDLPKNPSLSFTNPFGQWFLNFALTTALFALTILFIYQILRLAQNRPVSLRTLLSLGAVAMIPLHLTLPLALICHPFNIGGYLLYGLGEMMIGVAILRRMAWGLQAASEWPFWAAGLLVLSPLLIACLGVLLLSALMMEAVALMVLGIVV